MKRSLIFLFVCNFVIYCVIGSTTNQVEKLESVKAHTRSLVAESFFWDGFRITSKIRDEDIVGTPSWRTDGKTVLPLAPERAAIQARENLNLYLQGTNTYVVSSILIKKYMGTDHWFYRIGFVRSSEPESGTPYNKTEWALNMNEFCLIVLMSGRVIKPEFEKIEQPKETE